MRRCAAVGEAARSDEDCGSQRALIAVWHNGRMRASARILVVDDDEQIAAAVRRALAYEGYSVSVALDGHSALDSAREQMPDLVVLDVMLSGIYGVFGLRTLVAVLSFQRALNLQIDGLVGPQTLRALRGR